MLFCIAQALLWVGITRAKRKPTKLHPYGYMRDKFVFSLISAVGIFCLGAGVSVWHGCAGLLTPEPVEHLGWSIAGAHLSTGARPAVAVAEGSLDRQHGTHSAVLSTV